MGKARLLILLVAVLAGGAAFFLVSKGQSPGSAIADAIPQTAGPEMVRVLVASRDFPQGSILEPRRTRFIDWPKSSVPEYYVTEDNVEFVESLPQMRARREIHENEPIYADNTIQHGDRGMLAAIMTPGMRAVSTKVTAELSAGGFILPGDRVDVYVSGTVRDENGDGSSVAASLLLSDVRVLAIDQQTETDDENAVVARTVTLELAPTQVETFLMAREKSTVTIALRSIAEDTSGGLDTLSDEARPEDVIVVRYGQG
ncbi:MAG: Flp pilus assembly protein CpaB [Parvularcula sp.]